MINNIKHKPASIQDNYAPSVEDANNTRKPQKYTRVPSLQPHYNNDSQTCMINICSSNTVHKEKK